jgi:Xaa-Pro aminopeptidase
MGPGGNGVSFLAHGLGLEVDEFPFIARGQKMVLQEGMTLAFEPKWAVPGVGIAGYENTYVVTADGLESLNETPEDLVVIS